MSQQPQQTKLEETLSQRQQPNQGTLAPPMPAINPIVGPDATTDPAVPVPGTDSVEDLKLKLSEFEEKEKLQTELGMSEHQKEIKALQDQLRSMAMKPLVDSGFFKEAELKDYSPGELKFGNVVLEKFHSSGTPNKPPPRGGVDAPSKKKDLKRQWDDAANGGKGAWVA